MTKEEVRKLDNHFLLGYFINCLGYDYKMHEKARLEGKARFVNPDYSEDTLLLWEEVEERLNEVVTKGFDESGYRECLEKDIDNQGKTIKNNLERRDYTDLSWREGYRQGMAHALTKLNEFMSLEEE